MKILIWTGIVTGIIMLIYYIKSKKPILTAFKGIVSGGVAFFLVNYFGHYINIKLTISLFNIIVSLLLGIPGVILLVISKLILV